MAMRVRVVNGVVVAVCAATTPAKAGDLYIDDAQDHAIRSKLAQDWNSESGYGIPQYEDEDALRAREEASGSAPAEKDDDPDRWDQAHIADLRRLCALGGNITVSARELTDLLDRAFPSTVGPTGVAPSLELPTEQEGSLASDDATEDGCGCCGRKALDGSIWCDDCRTHVIQPKGIEHIAPHDRTFFAQHGKPCPFEEKPKTDIVTRLEEDGYDMEVIAASAPDVAHAAGDDA